MRRRRTARHFDEAEVSAAARAAAFDDARALAVELALGMPSRHCDAMSAGLVLVPGEEAYRFVGAWLVVQDAGSWAAPSWTHILISDQRLLCRFDDGRLLTLRWAEVTGVSIGLDQQHLVLNLGGHSLIGLLGVGTAAIAVAAVQTLYGVSALLTPPALRRLRASAAP